MWGPTIARFRALVSRSCRRRQGPRRGGPPSVRPLEVLEWRWVLSTTAGAGAGALAPAAVTMISASTSDSKSVTITYRVDQPISPGTPLEFGVYRSKDAQFDPGQDTLVATDTIGSAGQSAPLDQAGQPADGVGTHTLTVALPQGLPPYPSKPYVLAVAAPSSGSAGAAQTASFRVYTIGVVTHGGIQNTSWKHGPPWELQIAYWMKKRGFDAVIPYNWVQKSGTPGSAIKQAPRLARILLNAAQRFPADAPVDLQLIGHSEGTVVNTYALARLQNEMTPGLKAGYISDVLLDPHAANNAIASGKQVSYAGALGGLARSILTHYQSQAKDPPPYFPAVVDQAEVFFQHTKAAPSGDYNLWGQVPVPTDGPNVQYFNLSNMGVTHSGKHGIAQWYLNFIAPTLGEQAPLVQKLQFHGQVDGASPWSPLIVTRGQPDVKSAGGLPITAVSTNRPTFSGTAAPGSTVWILIGPADAPSQTSVVGKTRADSAGHWSLTARDLLPNGQYRVLATAYSPALATRPGLRIVPMQPLGRLVVNGAAPRA